MTRITRGGLMVVAAAMTVTVSACGHVWDSESTGQTTSGARTTPSVLSPTQAVTDVATPTQTSTSDPRSTTSPTATPPTAVSPTAAPEPPAPTPATTPTPTATTQPPSAPQPPAMLRPGDKGPEVLALQQRLSDLGYWLGTPDGRWGGLTTQAVYALQKTAGIGRDGVVGPAVTKALADGVRPTSRNGGTGIEVDVPRQIILVVRDGAVVRVLNTSTGSNVPYEEVYEGKTYRGSARTPAGSFSVFREVDKLDKGPLGSLYRPKYFNGGIAIHGAASIPPYPASHGCARVSNAAMDLIWAENSMAIGARVTVY